MPLPTFVDMKFPVQFFSTEAEIDSLETYVFLGKPKEITAAWPSFLNTWLQAISAEAGEKGIFQVQFSKAKAFLLIPEETSAEAARTLASGIKLQGNAAVFSSLSAEASLLAIEGMVLASYSFRRTSSLNVYLSGNPVDSSELAVLVNAVYQVRDWVNLPYNQLKSVDFHAEIERVAAQCGLKYEGLGPKAIEALKMVGLESVNKGSVSPPLFAILEHCPEGKSQEAPVVLVGKGVLFDSGGHSLKTAKGMEEMKGDMAGAATVLGTMMVLAQLNYPKRVVGLLPITDNRLAADSLSPGDVITYSNGVSVEVLNTDAEGRLILADALLYAAKLKPEWVLDMATLTGAAVAAVGEGAMVGFEHSAPELFALLQGAGQHVGEPVVQLPLLPEYEEQLKSDVADIKNIGSGYAGAITAALFLKRFTDFPWMHIDLSMALTASATHYRTAGGTGAGLRLLWRFLQSALKK